MEKQVCEHCGESLGSAPISEEEYAFCCRGCLIVWKFLHQNNLQVYYQVEKTPGVSMKEEESEDLSFLEQATVEEKLIQFRDSKMTRVTLSIPSIHCASCIWLLERLYQFCPGVTLSRVNFLHRDCLIEYLHQEVSLRQIAEVLCAIGYKPDFRLRDLDQGSRATQGSDTVLKLGVAGFCFGNIMLFSLASYLNFDVSLTKTLERGFTYISFVLSLPVVFYCSQDYFISGFAGLKKRYINIDFPISLGIIALFVLSCYEMISDTGIGYFDSLSGLLFFLLVARWIQNRTWSRYSFECDYRSYFPLSARVYQDGSELSLPISQIKEGMICVVRNGELIPADSTLLSLNADIDYSFVTGESVPNRIYSGEKIYAGGRLNGKKIEIQVQKEVSQSYLTKLWNREGREVESHISMTDRMASVFTVLILVLSFATLVYWLLVQPQNALNAFISVLIVACPCALAISAPFAHGNAMRLLSGSGMFLKNTDGIEKIAHIDTLVFDKTGTLTQSDRDCRFEPELNEENGRMIRSLALHSTHPVSRMIAMNLNFPASVVYEEVVELEGKGISGRFKDQEIRIGSREWISSDCEILARTLVAINGKVVCGFFTRDVLRDGIHEMLQNLSSHFHLSLISGDRDREHEKLREVFQNSGELLFEKSPMEKLDYIRELKKKGRVVAMIGDGLNDAGALMESDFGISISDNLASFSPACDAILQAEYLKDFFKVLRFSRACRIIVGVSFAFSILYNLVGIWFAAKAMLSPLVSAILMPLSSFTIMLWTTLATEFCWKWIFSGMDKKV